MKIIIGLGNPEKKYESTRHNLGRLIVKSFQEQVGFSDFKLKKKLQSLISEDKFNGEKIILALPGTFMNLSGKAIKSLIANYKLSIKDVWIIYDDFDIELGKLKISENKSSAGHNGIQSIIDELKTKDFTRFRIGIRPKRIPKTLEKFVLKKFTEKELETIGNINNKIIQVLEFALKEGIEKTMNRFNQDDWANQES